MEIVEGSLGKLYRLLVNGLIEEGICGREHDARG
jgi:hypothetical protein